jgi:hypothetical protein
LFNVIFVIRDFSGFYFAAEFRTGFFADSDTDRQPDRFAESVTDRFAENIADTANVAFAANVAVTGRVAFAGCNDISDSAG